MTRVQYELTDSVATITMDDGKANALGPDMQRELGEALDSAEAARAGVVLAGREGRFCGGFDLAVISAGGQEAVAMLRGGFELAARLLSFQTPVVIACTGHSIAMGAFLLLTGDYRVGPTGSYKVAANEVAIGMTMPYAALAIMRHRLTPAHFNRAVMTSETFTPEGAVEAGFLDRLVPAGDVVETAKAMATSFTGLDMAAHAASKLRARSDVLQGIRDGVATEFGAGRS